MPALGAPALLAVTAPAHRCTEGNVRVVGWFAGTQYARSTASAHATKQSPEWHLVADNLNEVGGAAKAHVVSGEALEEAHQAATTDTA